jgi:xanthine dehydrogenase accessory factor
MSSPFVDDTLDFYEHVVALKREGSAFVMIVLVDALGSTPQDAGAKMLVTSDGHSHGTVGGGRIEARAIAFAQEILASGPAARTQPRFVNWSLKADVGMTCGGSVKLYFEPHDAAEAAWPIVIFGAGHVAQALVPVLLPLPCSVTVCDPRREWLDRLPAARNLHVIAHDNPADLIPTLPSHSFILCMTKGHSTDLPILSRALGERNFPFVGVIGSAAKAAVLRRELSAAGMSPENAAKIHCPIGLNFGTNHPHEIALSIAGQLLAERDRLAKTP